MQAQCPDCSGRFQLPDDKVPDKPFKVRCPKCQSVVSLPGKGAGAPAPGPAPAVAAPAPPPPPPPPSKPAVPPRREHTGSDDAEDALVAIPNSSLRETLTATLGRLDYNVDVVEDVEEGARLLEQGAYALAVTSRSSNIPGIESLQQRILRLTADPRRRVFVILADDEFATADGTNAWAAQADLVINPKEADSCDGAIKATLQERKRLYQPFLDAQRRLETE